MLLVYAYLHAMFVVKSWRVARDRYVLVVIFVVSWELILGTVCNLILNYQTRSLGRIIQKADYNIRSP